MSSNRAFALFEVRDINSEERSFKGWATRPDTDRVGDVINPLGVKFTNPVVLLSQHNHSLPVGRVIFGKPTKEGVPFEAFFPEIKEEGSLRDRVETAWGEVKYGLIRAVSIGFRPLEQPVINKHGGADFNSIECFELSIVSVPALPSAVITSVKSNTCAMSKTIASEISRINVKRSDGAVSLITNYCDTIKSRSDGSVALAKRTSR